MLLTALIVIVSFFKFTGEKSDLTKIKVAEVTHSVFYAPWYVAIENGYFEDEGIEIDLILTPGADNVAAAVLSNDVHIGFAGSESTVYVYVKGEKDYLQTFAGLTKRDGQLILSREKIDNFSLESMIGKEVLVGRIGGMPFLNYENGLLNEGIDKSAVNMNTSVDFADLSSAFISGTGDFVNLFEPNATKLEQEGFGYVVAAVGTYSGEVPYTAYFARKSYINENEEIINKFRKALNRGLEFVHNEDETKIAKAILNQFPSNSLNEITIMLRRYKSIDSWYKSTTINEESFDNLQTIMINADNIKEKVPFDDLVIN